MNKRELKRLSRADLLEMLIIKCRENDALRAELEQVKQNAPAAPAAAVSAASISEDQVTAVLSAFRTAVDRYLTGAGEETK